MQKEDRKKRRIGVYLGVEPYVGGSFQYDQSIICALDALPRELFEIVVFYKNDLWKEYLSTFSFRMIKTYDRRQLWDIWGTIILKIASKCNFYLWRCKGLFAKISKFSQQFDKEYLDLLIFPSQEIYPAMVKTKTIGVIHDLMHRYEKFPESASVFEFKWREYLYKNVCESTERIFVDSEVGKRHVIECYGDRYSDKIEIMPFTPPHYLFENHEDILPSEVVLPNKFIFYPAQFWEHKNHKNLILATKMLKDRGIDIQLIFVGSQKNGYEEAMELIRANELEDNIHVFGYVSDSLMRILYRRARAMIMASFCGPTNIPPLEGMAMGCPVAVSNVYAMPWQIGEAGLVFDPKNVNEISNVIEKLWLDDELCSDLKRKGLKRAEFFSQAQFNDRFLKVIKSIF
ncbi:glycosyltransferase family 1 protein [Anaerovibrio sp. RM50]|uniref:glycosyltransferase family 4 protein n=1 Tax=Anaerovibrio sp. RM50 TaxID=1200557 RepID=UPI000486685A|nr:glycosyltransferase family 1 protein [Anaerovibrio sp. RM50]